MFLNVNGTTPFQFRSPSRWTSFAISRAGRKIVYVIATIFKVATFGLFGLAMLRIVYSSYIARNENAASVEEFGHALEFLIVAMIIILPTLVIAVTATVIVDQIEITRKSIEKGELRKFFATDDDFSYQLLFLNPSIKRSLRIVDYAQLVNEFFDDPAVRDADKVIRETDVDTFEGAHAVYTAKMLVINHLKAVTYKGVPQAFWCAIQDKEERVLKQSFIDLVKQDIAKVSDRKIALEELLVNEREQTFTTPLTQ